MVGKSMTTIPVIERSSKSCFAACNLRHIFLEQRPVYSYMYLHNAQYRSGP